MMSSGSNTTHLSLFKPTVGSTGWGESLNANLDVIDGAVSTVQTSAAAAQAAAATAQTAAQAAAAAAAAAQSTADSAYSLAASGGGTGGTGDRTYVHTQSTASASWVIDHNMDKHPSVTVVDSGGTAVMGAIVHNSLNRLTITFNAVFGGVAYCN